MESMKKLENSGNPAELTRRERPKRRAGINRREEIHWGVKLLVYMWAAAAFFVAGMVVGGIFGQKCQAKEPFLGEAAEGSGVLIGIPCLDQREKYPTGCESVTAVMALEHAGVELTVEEFIGGCLPRSPAPRADGQGGYFCGDPRASFLGDPCSEDGWGCYSPVIKRAVEKILAEKKPSLQAVDLSGKPLKALTEEYVSEDVPVMVWATRGMEEPRYAAAMTIEGTGERMDWISPEHCLLLVGENEEFYIFNDPLEGKPMAYGKRDTELAYEALGCQALAIVGGAGG